MQNRKFTSGEVRAINKQDRTVTFLVSDGSRDRHGTVLDPNKWKLDNYRKNPIVGYSHELYGFLAKTDPDSVIGKSEVYQDGTALLADITFEPESINEQAEKIWQKILFGSIRAASVGFLPVPDDKGNNGRYGEGEERQGGKRQTFYYNGQELIELSIVNLPSNPNAILKKAAPDVKTQVLGNLLEEATGLRIEELYNMTVKGILDIVKGDDAQKILEAETGKKIDLEAGVIERIRQDIKRQMLSKLIRDEQYKS